MNPMRHLMTLVEAASPVSAIWAEVEPFITQELHDAEALWVGGVADFGDKRAAQIIQHVPGYEDYINAFRTALKRHLGWPLILYRTMPTHAVDEIATGGGGYSTEWATSLSLEWVKRFAAKFHHTEPQSIVEIRINDPQAIIMRGSENEAEVIIDTGWIGDWEAAIRRIA